MYVIHPPIEAKSLTGRPKREDKTTRANFKLNIGIRRVLKNESQLNNRSESSQVERLVIEVETLKRVLQKHPEIAALLLPKFNEELPFVVNEITEQIDHDQPLNP